MLLQDKASRATFNSCMVKRLILDGELKRDCHNWGRIDGPVEKYLYIDGHEGSSALVEYSILPDVPLVAVIGGGVYSLTSNS